MKILTGVLLVCEKCGGRLTRRTSYMASRQLRVSYAHCAKCGEEYRLHEAQKTVVPHK